MHRLVTAVLLSSLAFTALIAYPHFNPAFPAPSAARMWLITGAHCGVALLANVVVVECTKSVRSRRELLGVIVFFAFATAFAEAFVVHLVLRTLDEPLEKILPHHLAIGAVPAMVAFFALRVPAWFRRHRELREAAPGG